MASTAKMNVLLILRLCTNLDQRLLATYVALVGESG